MSAKTTLKEELDKFRGLKTPEYRLVNGEPGGETKVGAAPMFMSEVKVTLHHTSGSKSFVQCGDLCTTIKRSEASAAQALLDNTEVAHFCVWDNWEHTPPKDHVDPSRPASTSTIQAENSTSSFSIIEPDSLEDALLSSSPRTPNGSKLDAFYFETTACAPFVCRLTASVLTTGMKPLKKLVVIGEPSLTQADAEHSAYQKFLMACFTRTFENPTNHSRKAVPTLLIASVASGGGMLPGNEVALVRRQPSDDIGSDLSASSSSPPARFDLPPPPPAPLHPAPAVVLPILVSLRERIMGSASAALRSHLYILDSVLSTDQQCRLEMWVPENNLAKEMSRDVLLVMHTLFPNPVLADEIWTLMDKRYTLPEAEVDELRGKEAANRAFLVRYILLLHRNLTFRKKQRSVQVGEQHAWCFPLACALCHGGRVLTEVTGGYALTLLSILYHGAPGEQLGMIKHRWSSHKISFEKEGFFKERKAYHYADTYGFNISFGGLGNHYDRDKKIIGPEGVGIERKMHAKKWKDLKKHPQQGHVLIKWHEAVTENHQPTSALLVGIENVDYAFKHGHFGAGHSMIGLSGSKSVSNGEKLSCVFKKHNAASSSETATPNKLGGLRVSYPGSKIPAFEAYCAKFLELGVDDQMILMLAILTGELDVNIERDVLGEKHTTYPK